MTGHRRGVQYWAGPGFAFQRGGPNRGAGDLDLWADLTREFRRLAYVRLCRLGRRMQTRAQARAALDGLQTQPYLIVDFRSVDQVTEAFIEELHVLHDTPEPINARPEVEAVIDRVRRFHELRKTKEWEE